jgi:hypothetical protein
MKYIDAEGNKKGRFVPGDPKTGERPTRLDHSWCNMIQDEIASVVLQQKIPLDETGLNNHQLSDAIQKWMARGNELDSFAIKNGTHGFEDTPVKLSLTDQVKVVMFTAYVEKKVQDQVSITLHEGAFVRKSNEPWWTHPPSSRSIEGEDNTQFSIGPDGTIQYSCTKLGKEGDSYQGWAKISHVKILEK